MDWTAVFAETGEDTWEPPKPRTAPRLSRLLSEIYLPHPHRQGIRQPLLRWLPSDDDDHDVDASQHRIFDTISPSFSWDTSKGDSSYNLMALYCLSINYILGVGCLGIPYAFARAGFILCSFIIVIVTLMSYLTVMWVAETGARVELEIEFNESKSSKKSIGSQYANVTEETTLLNSQADKENTIIKSIDISRYEVIDLVSYYLGPMQKNLYQISLLALMYVGLLAYTQVFCAAISAVLANFLSLSSRTILPQVVFGAMVVPLSCMELEEQVAMQAIMALVRFVAIWVMIIGSTVALFTDSTNGNADSAPYLAPDETEGCRMSYTACYSGFGVAFSTALFSQLFQHSVPGLLRQLRGQSEKIKKVPRVFGASLFTTCSFYLVLGTTAASYFGASTRSSVNLNFADFIFGLNPDHISPAVLVSVKMASTLVVMFPALDTLSVFPLIANTLGSNLLASSSPTFIAWIAKHLPNLRIKTRRLFGKDKIPIAEAVEGTHQHRHDVTETKRKLWEDASRLATVVWRLVAAIPPLIGSIWATDLSFSMLLAGVAGIYVAFFAPALLQISSCRRQQKTNVYSGWYSSTLWTYPVLAFASFSLVAMLLQIQDAWIAIQNP